MSRGLGDVYKSQLHGGWVWVDDRTDRRPGARFLVAWPVGEVPSDDQHLAEELTP